MRIRVLCLINPKTKKGKREGAKNGTAGKAPRDGAGLEAAAPKTAFTHSGARNAVRRRRGPGAQTARPGSTPSAETDRRLADGLKQQQSRVSRPQRPVVLVHDDERGSFIGKKTHSEVCSLAASGAPGVSATLPTRGAPGASAGRARPAAGRLPPRGSGVRAGLP